MAHNCALLLSGSDIRFLGTTGPEPEPEPDIRYIPSACCLPYSTVCHTAISPIFRKHFYVFDATDTTVYQSV